MVMTGPRFNTSLWLMYEIEAALSNLLRSLINIYHPLSQVAEHTGLLVQPHKAIVGANAFKHESGIHQSPYGGQLAEKETRKVMEFIICKLIKRERQPTKLKHSLKKKGGRRKSDGNLR
ncbi:hypothetical protein Droror1_Dr00009184 [Drosera rotundifolia]